VPFVQKSDESIHPIINRVLSDRPPDVRRQSISDELAAIIDSLLAKDPSKRPPSAAELFAQFKALGPLTPVQPQPTGAGATQIVAPAAAPMTPAAPPAAPSAPQGPPPGAPLPQPAAAPRAQDAAPGLHNPQASPAWLAAQNAPVQQPAVPVQQPMAQAPALASQRVTKEPSSNLKMFVLAYVATLIIGGLGVFLASRFIGGDDDGEGAAGASATTAQAFVDPAEVGPDPGAPLPVEGQASESAALTIPLAVADTSFGDGAETSDDSPGPGAGTLCDNAPETDGLVEWKGHVITTDLGLRTLYQVVSRFETAEQATAYLDAYAGTNDCDSWLVATEEDGASDVVYTALQTPPPTYGDQSRQFTITGELDSVVSLHAKVLLIQSGTDVLSLSITAISATQVDELDQLAPVAVERLGYTAS
ncbi:MAG: hypothetical protein ACR2QK_14890, partial [Acidimicrobiales bacterium]